MTAKILKHKFQSAIADGADATLVRPLTNWNDDHNLWYGYRTVTGTTDTITNDDHFSLISYSNAGAVAVSMAAPTGGNMPAGWMTRIRNTGVGTVTITGTGGATFNGSATIVLVGGDYIELFSNGTAAYQAVIAVTRGGKNVFSGTNDFNGTTTIAGTLTNDNAAAGDVGEYLEANLTSAGEFFVSANAYATIRSLAIPAGDWDVSAVVNFNFSGNTLNPICFTYISDVAANGGSMTANTMFVGRQQLTAIATQQLTLRAGPVRLSLASTQTWYCVEWVSFNGNCACCGGIRARRAR
jgi:hypothetical protein